MDGHSPNSPQTLSAEKPTKTTNIVDLTSIDTDTSLANPDNTCAERESNKGFAYGPAVTVVADQFTARSPGRPPTAHSPPQGHTQPRPQAQTSKLPVIGGKVGHIKFTGRINRRRVVPNPLDVRRASPTQDFRSLPDQIHVNKNGPPFNETKPSSPQLPLAPQPFPNPPSPNATAAHATHAQPAYVEDTMSTGFDADYPVPEATSPVKFKTYATKYDLRDPAPEAEDFPDGMHRLYVPTHRPLPSEFGVSSPQTTPQMERNIAHPTAPKNVASGSRSSRSSRVHRHSADRSSHRHRAQPAVKPPRKSASESKSAEAMRKVRAQSHSSNISRRRDGPDTKKIQKRHDNPFEKPTAKSVTSSPELKQQTVRVRHKFATNMAEVLNEFNMNQETALKDQRERYRDKVKSLKLELEMVAEESSRLAARSSEKSREIKELQVSEAEKDACIAELQTKLKTNEKERSTLAERFAAFRSRCSSIIEEQRALYTDTKTRCEETITEVRNIAATRISEAEAAAQKTEKVRKALMERVRQDISQNKKESSELYEKIRSLMQQVEEKDLQLTHDQDTIRGLTTRVQDIQASSAKFEKLAVQNEEALRKLGEQLTKESSRHDGSARETCEALESISHQLGEVLQTAVAQPGLVAGLGEAQTKGFKDIHAQLEAMLVNGQSVDDTVSQLPTCIETQIGKVWQRLDSQLDTMSQQLSQKSEEKAILSAILEDKKTRCEALEQEIHTLQNTSKEQTERINTLQQNILALEAQHNNDLEEIQRLRDVDTQLEDQKENLRDELDARATTIRELEDKLRDKEEAYSAEVRTFGIEVSKLHQALREQESSNQIMQKQAADAVRSQVKNETDRIISDTRRLLQQTEQQRDSLAAEIRVLKGTVQEKENRIHTAVKSAIDTARRETRIDMERTMSADQRLLNETQKHRDNLLLEVKKLETLLEERQQAAQAAIQEASDTARREARAEMERDIADTTQHLHEAQQQMDTLKASVGHLESAIQEKEQAEQQGSQLLDSLRKALAAEEATSKRAIQGSTERLAKNDQQISELKARVFSLEGERNAATKSVADLRNERDQQHARFEALAAGLIDWAQQSGLATDSLTGQILNGKVEELKASVLQTLAQLSLSQRLKALNTAPSASLSPNRQGFSEQTGMSGHRHQHDQVETANMDDGTTLLGSPGSFMKESHGTWVSDKTTPPGFSPLNDPGSQRRRIIIQTPMSEPDPSPPSVDQEKIRRREALQPKSILRRVTRSASRGRPSQENINGMLEPGTNPDPLGIQQVIPDVETPTRGKPASMAAVKPAPKRVAKRKAPANSGSRPRRNKTTPSATPTEHPISALGGSRTLSLEPESPVQQPKPTTLQTGKSPLGAPDQVSPSPNGGLNRPSPEKRTPLPSGPASWTGGQFQPTNAGEYGSRGRRRSLSPTFETDASGLPILRSQPRFWTRPQVPPAVSHSQGPQSSTHAGGYQDSIVDSQE
ncbi:hypothetical protein QBC40DRAFT_199123, partial [Triangularia verruculosa]